MWWGRKKRRAYFRIWVKKVLSEEATARTEREGGREVWVWGGKDRQKLKWFCDLMPKDSWRRKEGTINNCIGMIQIKKGLLCDLSVALIEACFIDSEEKIGFYSKDSRILQGSKLGQLCSLSVFQINGLERVRVWWGGGQRKDLSRGLLPPTKHAGILNWGDWVHEKEKRMVSHIFWRRNVELNLLDKDKREPRGDPSVFGFNR